MLKGLEVGHPTYYGMMVAEILGKILFKIKYEFLNKIILLFEVVIVVAINNVKPFSTRVPW